MIHPATIRYVFSEQFEAELVVLKSRYPRLRTRLDAELNDSHGTDWASLTDKHKFEFREDYFDGSATIGTLMFCAQEVMLMVTLHETAILLTTFVRPELRLHLP